MKCFNPTTTEVIIFVRKHLMKSKLYWLYLLKKTSLKLANNVRTIVFEQVLGSWERLFVCFVFIKYRKPWQTYSKEAYKFNWSGCEKKASIYFEQVFVYVVIKRWFTSMQNWRWQGNIFNMNRVKWYDFLLIIFKCF